MPQKKKIAAGIDGQFLSTKQTQRPRNKAVMEVFEYIMDLENNPEINRAFKLRFFGLTPCRDEENMQRLYNWMSLEIDSLEQQSMVFEPVLGIMRKLCFETDKYYEAVRVRKKMMALDWTSDESFEKSLDAIISHLLGKKIVYYKTIKTNRNRKLKRKYSNKNKNHNNSVCNFLFFCVTKKKYTLPH